MGAQKIKQELRERWGGVPALDLCLSIVDFIDKLPVPEREMLTYRTLEKAVGSAGLSEDLLIAITILVTSRIEALEARALFIDDNGDEFTIETDELSQIKTDGELIHPETGNPVINFEEKIIPYFVPTSRFLEAD